MNESYYKYEEEDVDLDSDGDSNDYEHIFYNEILLTKPFYPNTPSFYEGLEKSEYPAVYDPQLYAYLHASTPAPQDPSNGETTDDVGLNLSSENTPTKMSPIHQQMNVSSYLHPSPSCDLSKKKSFPTLIPEEGVSTKSMNAESSETEQEPVPTFDSLKTNIFIRSTGVKEVYY